MITRRILRVLVDPSEGMREVTNNPDPLNVLVFDIAVVGVFAALNAIHFSALAPSQFLGLYWATSILLPLGGFLLKVIAIAIGLVFLSSFLLGNASFRQALAVAAYSYIPVNLFSYGLSVLLITNHWTSSIQPTTLAVLDVWLPENMHSLIKLLSLIDPFKIWAVLLVGIGFSLATKCPVRKGMTAAFVSWMAILAMQYLVLFR